MDDNEVETPDHTVHGGRETDRIQVDEGPDVAKADDGGGDVCVQVDEGDTVPDRVDEEGDDNVPIPIDDGPCANHS